MEHRFDIGQDRHVTVAITGFGAGATPITSEDARAFLAKAVRAVNAHDALVGALRYARNELQTAADLGRATQGQADAIANADAALKLAEGK